MSIVFSSVSHRAHAELGKSISLGHVHQLLAAALGYGSLAAYKASPQEPPNFDGVAHIVFDDQRLHVRQQELGHIDPPDGPWLSHTLRRALTALLPDAAVHLSEVDLIDNITPAVEGAIDDSGAYASEMAITNAYGPGEYNIELSASEELNDADSDWVFEVDGTSGLDQDQDKPYHGHEIAVSARVIFPKLGRRLLGEYEVDEIGASVIDDWRDPDDQPRHQAV